MMLMHRAEESPAVLWTKSSHSSNDGPECVEVAAVAGRVHVRDSKDVAASQLAFDASTWSAFIGLVTQ